MSDPDAAKFLRQLRKVGVVWMLAFPGLVMTAGSYIHSSTHPHPPLTVI